MRLILSLAAASLLSVNTAEAASGCGTPNCRIPAHSCKKCNAKTCRIVCEMVKVKKTVWAVECEEFCPMLPGCGPLPCCKGCGKSCGSSCGQSCCGDTTCRTGCCGKDPCSALENRRMVTPKAAKTRARKKLVKKEVVCEVPVYKCVVSDHCSSCGLGEPAPVEAPTAAERVTRAAPLPPMMPRGY